MSYSAPFAYALNHILPDPYAPVTARTTRGMRRRRFRARRVAGS